MSGSNFSPFSTAPNSHAVRDRGGPHGPTPPPPPVPPLQYQQQQQQLQQYPPRNLTSAGDSPEPREGADRQVNQILDYMLTTVKSLPPDFDMHDNNYPDNGPFAAGSGTLPYAIPVPQSQQLQQQQQHSSHPPHPPPHHKHNFPVPMGLTSGGGMTVGGGPAVPAPRSAATLLAEATGAPPPPPAPTRASHVQATLNAAAAASSVSNSGLAIPTIIAGGVAGVPAAMLAAAASMQQQQQQQQIPAPPTSAPSASTAAAAVARMSPNAPPQHGNADKGDVAGATAAAAAAAAATAPPLFTTKFQRFTPAAAAMLESMVDAEPLSGNAAASSAASPASSTAVAVAGAAAAAATRFTAMNPYSKVEVELSVSAVARSGFEMWGRDADDELDSATDLLLRFLKPQPREENAASKALAQENVMEQCGRDWYTHCAENGDPRTAASAIQARLNQVEGNNLRAALEDLAGAMVVFNMWAIVPCMTTRLQGTMRHLVLRKTLKQLLDLSKNPTAADRYAALLAKMVSVGWLTVSGAVTLVDELLQNPTLTEIGLRSAATLLLEAGDFNAVRAALQERPGIVRRLAILYETNPALEVDVALLCRWLRGLRPILHGTAALVRTPEASVTVAAPVTTMAYFGVRDELVTGDMSGVVTLWGPPTQVRDKSVLGTSRAARVVVNPRGVVPLPMNCVPVAMAGQRLDGQYLAIAGMPLKGRRPYAAHNAAPQQPTARGATSPPNGMASNGSTAATLAAAAADASGAAAVSSVFSTAAGGGSLAAGAIIVITCNENSIQWNKGEIIMRPPGVAITAITAFRNSIVAVGESVVSCAAPGPAVADPSAAAPHRLSFMDVVNGTVMRQVPRAHDYFVTALTVLEESSYVLLSGSRDAAVKLWDPRSRADCPVVNTAFCTTAAHHDTTISTLHTYGFNILSTDVDGVVAVWDLRNMAAPQLRHELSYPIADATLLHSNRAALATPRGIVTVALDTLRPLDLCHKSVYSHVLANDAGTLVFTAAGRELEMVAVNDI